MFESRCGVCCSHCERKEKVSCKGCIDMKTSFWGGECKVKSCCENKELDHCGQCEVFPCKTLAMMGKDYGYDSAPLIEQYWIWAKEK